MEKEYQIILFWSKDCPKSVNIKNIIEKSPYGNVIGLVSADNAHVRNSLMFGAYPQAVIPIFMIVENGKPTFYQIKDEKKVLNLASSLLEHLQLEETMTDATTGSHISNLSLSSRLDEI